MKRSAGDMDWKAAVMAGVISGDEAAQQEAPGGDEIPFGEAAFQAYFKTTTKVLSDDYYGYLFDLAG